MKAIPEMKAKMFENQMTIKYVVDIHPKFWPALNPKYNSMTAEEKIKFEDEWFDAVEKFLVGNDNAYKSLFNRLVFDEKTQQYVEGVKITALDDKIKDGKLIPDTAAGSSEILFAVSLNPALVGLSIPGSGSAVTSDSGSNIREAFLTQIMQLEIERHLDAKVFDIAKKANGWQERLGKGMPLVLRYPNQLLTTLNTGANTQPTA